ncbi:MAG: hypothetical protein Q8O42_09530 [Acidobacteriota bacterium]|nr:hypothetical protein [Acidobacteriota bacterium]
MADELKLDIIVDEHGSAKALADVDAGVNKVVGSAKQATPEVERLGGSFGGAASLLSRFAIGAAVAVPVITFLSSQLRAAAEDARKFTDAAKDLETDAQRIQALTHAAADNRVGFDQMVGGLTRLQQSIGSGKLNDELRELHINLDGFRQGDITEQFLEINAAIAAIEDPLERAAMKARIFKGDAEEMGRLAKAGFQEAVDGAVFMKTETIAILDEMSRKWDETTNYIAAKSKSVLADMLAGAVTAGRDGGGIIGLMNGFTGLLYGEQGPTPPGSPLVGPAQATGPGTDIAEASARLTEQRNAQVAANEAAQAIEEANFAMDAYLRKLGQVTTFVPEFMAIHELEVQLAKQGEAWADVLDANVGAAVDRINAKFVNAVMMNTQLMGGAQSERDRLMSKLTSASDPNASEYDTQFNTIDQEHKRKMAAVDQTDRTSAAAAENAILEETNLKVQELQMHWEGVLSKQDGAIKGADTLRQSYEQLNQSFQPKGGTALPGGLVAPTAEQVATGRYFGPVTPTGEPDLARMGGAAPMVAPQITVNAQGAFLDSPQHIDRLARTVIDAVMKDSTLQRQFGRS